MNQKKNEKSKLRNEKINNITHKPNERRVNDTL